MKGEFKVLSKKGLVSIKGFRYKIVKKIKSPKDLKKEKCIEK